MSGGVLFSRLPTSLIGVALYRFALPPGAVSRRSSREGTATQEEVDEVICWLTGHDASGLHKVIDDETDLQIFFGEAPAMNPNAGLITGVICGHRVE